MKRTNLNKTKVGTASFDRYKFSGDTEEELLKIDGVHQL
jgi:hypothetical protein